MSNKDDKVLLGHGSGGLMMKRIIDEVFLSTYSSDALRQGNDCAVLPWSPCETAENTMFDQAIPNRVAPSQAMPTQNTSHRSASPESDSNSSSSLAIAPGDRLAISTDSFVVTPHFFPGGDIGHLAVCGTVNDVATSGARPLYLTAGFILEEGFPISDLRRICKSMATTAAEAGVCIVTGDTKVVNKGSGDGVYINTTGVGVVPAGCNLGGQYCQPGDAILVSGTLGDHGITIMGCREGLGFTADLQSDAAPLNHLIEDVLLAAPDTRCFRDPTRGGLASTANELAEQSSVDIVLNEDAIPVKPAVRGACEMLGYDVLQVANEGKMVAVVPSSQAQAALEAMRANRYGADAALIGTVEALPSQADNRSPRVSLRTTLGTTRVLDMLVGEQLPRIC